MNDDLSGQKYGKGNARISRLSSLLILPFVRVVESDAVQKLLHKHGFAQVRMEDFETL
jgi:hypothetical protein